MDGTDEIAAAIAAAREPLPLPPNDRQLADFELNDLGNARRLSARFGHELIYVDESGWHVYDGKRWCGGSPNQGPEALKRAHETAEAIKLEVRALEDELSDLLASRRPVSEIKALEARIQRHRK